jgi:uncharacterized membrane protein YccC
MKLNPNWDRAVGVVAACIAVGLALFIFGEVRNLLVYLALAAAMVYFARRRMKLHETPFERRERLTKRMRM